MNNKKIARSSCRGFSFFHQENRGTYNLAKTIHSLIVHLSTWKLAFTAWRLDFEELACEGELAFVKYVEVDALSCKGFLPTTSRMCGFIMVCGQNGSITCEVRFVLLLQRTKVSAF